MLLNVWLDAVDLHVRAELLWHFLQHPLGQLPFLDGIVVSDELDDVTSTGLADAILEQLTITIKLLHHREVSFTDADDDDRNGVVGKLDDKVLRLFHVMDCAISQDQHHLVVSSLAVHSLHPFEHVLEQGCKVSGSCKFDLLQGLAVRLRDSFDA